MEEQRKWGIGVKELALLAVSDQVDGEAGMVPRGRGEVVSKGTTSRFVSQLRQKEIGCQCELFVLRFFIGQCFSKDFHDGQNCLAMN